ncbi:nucleic acid-binding protein [Spirulina sp. 06S082]|uniref:type II toxin-antitoxin system VapC family toxin n=1 Tax=Spirulina sp. 06S082 TaxID=3110248 RepID=UPI002B1F8ACD|nr:nucleic acid-binding protein [Spirulina sp. 06S082]MEA5470036.1 nucleic acid-binding protein [Spirulina sp. 06S082]
MSRAILLDTGPLGMIVNPRASSPIVQSCQLWLESLLVREGMVVLPEISDYEVRRELIRANKVSSLRRLDTFKRALEYHPLTTEIMLKAAELWADVRRRGRPTADPQALDGDVILAAQAMMVKEMGYDAIVATTNVKHLSLFVDARDWQEI